MAQLTVPTPVTRKQVPATQIQGARNNMPVDYVMNVKLGTLVIQTAKVCIYYLFLVPVRFQI